MRRRLLVVPALVVLAVPGQAAAQATGGTTASSLTGGAEYGQLPAASARHRPAPLVVRSFRVTPSTIAASGGSARFSFRVDGGAPRVRVRIRIVRRGRSAAARSLLLRRRTGRSYSRAISVRQGELAAGAYVATLQVVDALTSRRRLRARAASTSARLRVAAAPAARPAPTPVAPAPAPASPLPPPPAAPLAAGRIFPVRGAHSFGGEDGRFAASRGERLHFGQDVLAAEGTPLVAPCAGVVYWRAYQAGGAGHYLVIRGADGRDYVLMHMRAASPLAPGTPVAAGAAVGEVGSTGSSSGPHLHFEIWPDGWYASAGSHPIDPLPELRTWAGA